MARRSATAEPEVTFSNGASSTGYKLSDFIDSDILLHRLGTTTVNSEYGENEATRAILVELCNWDDPAGPAYFIKGEVYVFAIVIQDALEENNVVVGTIAKPARAYVMRALPDDRVERVRKAWPRIWPELQTAANEANEAYDARQTDDSQKATQEKVPY